MITVSSVRGFCDRGNTVSASSAIRRAVLVPGSCNLTGHGTPKEASELTTDRCDGDLGAFAPKQQVHVLPTEAASGPVGVGEHLWLHSFASLREEATTRVVAAVVPGCFNEQPSQMAVACLGNPPLATFVAAGMLGGDEPEVGHELAGIGEAAEIPDVRNEGQRDEGLDPFEGGELLRLLAVAVLGKASDHIKTDRRDARTLAITLRAGQLTGIYVPTAQDESVRDYLRMYEDLRGDLRICKQRVLHFLLRRGHSLRSRRPLDRQAQELAQQLGVLRPESGARYEALRAGRLRQEEMSSDIAMQRTCLAVPLLHQEGNQ